MPQTGNQIISYPFGNADVQAQQPSASPIAANVVNQETILPIAQMVANATLNIAVGAGIRAGANLSVKVSIDATNRTLTLGAGLAGAAQVLLANKTYVLRFHFDGTAFNHTITNALN